MANGALEQAEALRIRAQLAGAFNPGGPVSRIDLLVGRLEQINEVFSAVEQRGLSVLLFGERGVGKTSLASLIHELWSQYYSDPDSVVALRTNCTPSSTFESIWSNILELMQDVYDKRGEPFPSGDSWTEIFAEIRNEAATPHNVRRLLTLADKRFIIVIDEFDQITDDECTQFFASTIKELSDYLVEATLILVGVADTVDDLIADHASIDRAAVQVSLPRMPVEELRDIITRGYQAVGLACADSLLERMAQLAHGLPHYAHRLGQEAGYAAVGRDSLRVDQPDLEHAIERAITLTHESIRASYHSAATTNRPDSLYGTVLLACALAPVDDLGYFAAADVRAPLKAISERSYEIPQFVRHLRAFCESGKGPVLQVVGEDWRRRYRFVNPLLRPYVVLRGVREGVITEQLARSP